LVQEVDGVVCALIPLWAPTEISAKSKTLFIAPPSGVYSVYGTDRMSTV
jgi:hypothetical protein